MTLIPASSDVTTNQTITLTQAVTVFVPQITKSIAVGSNVTLINIPSQYIWSQTGLWLMAGIAYTAPFAAPGIQWDVATAAPVGTTFGNGTVAAVQIISPNENGIVTPTGLDNAGSVYYSPPALDWKSNDSPGVSVGLFAASIDDVFQDYFMYLPPQCGSNPVSAVPIANISSWTAEGNWTSAGGLTNNSVSVSGINSGNAWPIWTQSDQL